MSQENTQVSEKTSTMLHSHYLWEHLQGPPLMQQASVQVWAAARAVEKRAALRLERAFAPWCYFQANNSSSIHPSLEHPGPGGSG